MPTYLGRVDRKCPVITNMKMYIIYGKCDPQQCPFLHTYTRTSLTMLVLLMDLPTFSPPVHTDILQSKPSFQFYFLFCNYFSCAKVDLKICLTIISSNQIGSRRTKQSTYNFFLEQFFIKPKYLPIWQECGGVVIFLNRKCSLLVDSSKSIPTRLMALQKGIF